MKNICGVLFVAVLFMGIAQASSTKRVCVALVSNRSTQSIFAENLTDRLLKALKSNKSDAIGIPSVSTMSSDLEPSQRNRDEARDAGCDFLLLTQVSEVSASQEVRSHLAPPLPSADASERDAYDQNQLNLEFALFTLDKPNSKPVAHSFIPTGEPTNVTSRVLQAMDRVANRVSRELKKN